MLYTSKESWDYVQFRFSKKKYDLLDKNWRNFDFSDFRIKIEADQMPLKQKALIILESDHYSWVSFCLPKPEIEK